MYSMELDMTQLPCDQIWRILEKAVAGGCINGEEYPSDCVVVN